MTIYIVEVQARLCAFSQRMSQLYLVSKNQTLSCFLKQD